MAKVNIDLEKLICQLIENACISTNRVNKYAITEALKEQGIEYKDGSLHYIGEEEKKPDTIRFKEEPFKIKKGNWYMCIKDYHKDNDPTKKELSFKKGCIYDSFCDSSIRTIQGYGELFNPKTLIEHFRPAREDEFSCYEPRFRKGDILTDGEKFYKVLDWDYNENNVAFYKLDYGILKGNWLAYDADQKLTLTTRLELPETTTKFKKENQQTLEEISKKGYVDMGRPIEFAIQKEPDFDGMVEEYKQMNGYNILIKWAPHLRYVVDLKIEAYKDGLKDMWKHLKEE